MPKLIDWGVRYELIREAVVRIAAREGIGGVSTARVAQELQVSVSTLRRTVDDPRALASMGAGLLARRRRQRRYLRGRPRGVEHGSVGHVAWILTAELPEDEEDLEALRAWVQLTSEPVSGECRELCEQDENYLHAIVEGALEQLGTETATRLQQALRLRALLDGLVAARARETVTYDEAIACLEASLRELPLSGDLSPDAA